MAHISSKINVFLVKDWDSEDDSGRNMATYEDRDGNFQLGVWSKKSGFKPVGQATWPSGEDAQEWAQQAWECGEKFDV
jgi:hypothetical protein